MVSRCHATNVSVNSSGYENVKGEVVDAPAFTFINLVAKEVDKCGSANIRCLIILQGDKDPYR